MPAHPSSSCTAYWDESDWLVPLYILERWCQRDEACMQAKLQALLSACERGEVNYRRSDGKWFDDPVHELYQRRKLLIERQSFNRWCTKLEGKSPLTNNPAPPAPQAPQTPSWAREWTMAPAGMSVASKAPLEASFGHASTDTKPDAGKTLEERDNGLETEELSEAALRKLGVPSDDIVDAFKVCSDSAQNDEWWQQRMSNAKRNKKLLPARIRAGKSSKGVQRIQSWWSPLLIASFLIQGKHMPPTKAVRILNESFPDFSVDSHLLMP